MAVMKTPDGQGGAEDPTQKAVPPDNIPLETIPLDYRDGYARARPLDPETADSYIAHTLSGDPKGDEVVGLLADMQPQRRQALYRGCMDADPDVMKGAPTTVREFFEELSEPPDWYDPDATLPGIRAFHANADLVLQAFVAGVLIEGFGTNISKSFVITGRLREQGITRLKQNNRHVLDIFLPGGLERYGDGWKLSVRIRLVHAQVRRILSKSPSWDTESWGTPISAAHMGLSAASFSARLLMHSMRLGAKFTQEERESFMLVWRYSSHLMGVPEPMLRPTEKEALHLYDIAVICEPPPDLESVITANALIKAVPKVVGITREKEAKTLLKRVYTVSRALIGDELSDQLRYPQHRTTGVLQAIRLQGRVNRGVRKALPRLSRKKRLNTFSHLISVAAYDEGGISYAMPN